MDEELFKKGLEKRKLTWNQLWDLCNETYIFYFE